MKYLPIREIDTLSNALNFSTPDCHVIGSCDLYTTKAAGGDKKLYKNIESSLESQYESLVRLSASLSPPLSALSEDGKSERDGSRKRSRTIEPEIDLSRSSPFGPLSQISSRRTFAYLIATLNASHPDYDFSHFLRPADFRKERSLRGLQHTIDSTLQNLRPRQTAAMALAPPPQFSAHSSSPYSGGLPSDVWTPHMWKLLDAEMSLRACEKYSYVPADDPFEGEEGALWSMHYFFFNKERKRVAYLYLRGFSVISHSPVNAPFAAHANRHAWTSAAATTGSSQTLKRAKISRGLSDGEGAGKRASYWLGSTMLRENDVDTSGDDGEYMYDDDDDEMVTIPEYEGYDDDDEVEVPFMNLDDIRNDLVDGRLSYTGPSVMPGGIDLDLADGDDYNDSDLRAWSAPSAVVEKAGTPSAPAPRRSARHVRGISEEIGASMDMDV